MVQDLLDTICANADRCVGMAANMIGERKTILAAQIGKDYLVMINPKIVDHSKQCYETEESCLSLTGQRPVKRYSVIVVEYLDRKFKRKKQTFRDFELILLDDGSPDGSGAICDAYAARDSRVRAIHQGNAGVCAARNTCLDWVLSNSDSQWIFFIDNDDWMHPETLERLHLSLIHI